MPRDLPPALQAVLASLRCPNCAAPLADHGGTLRCGRGHSFDVARGGYVSLLTGAPARSGDDDEMARARHRFLEAGHYRPLRERIVELAGPVSAPGGGFVIEVGCGTGYYLAGLLEQLPGTFGLGFDTSPRALRFAARAHARAAAISADVFAPFPVRDAAADLILDVFAPRNPEEFHRVLRPGGHLVVARPTGDHLRELRAVVPGMVDVDPRKEERLHGALDPLFATVAEEHVPFTVTLAADAARDLVAMTPSARHVSADDLTQQLPGPLEVTGSVLVSVHTAR